MRSTETKTKERKKKKQGKASGDKVKESQEEKNLCQER